MIILVDKRIVLDVFGTAAKFLSACLGYFLSYTAYALALGITDPKELTPYGKNYMLRHREKETKEIQMLPKSK